jgi:hypothetical protein
MCRKVVGMDRLGIVAEKFEGSVVDHQQREAFWCFITVGGLAVLAVRVVCSLSV